ncbi:DUF2917 domain-containing protein [Candidatus Accumulibacter sp. ACC003]|uniref:DUF2917 domain-containing protein n=1 Tax=Candidatus Accumulibacter sp. ACC003 TaxID=2823334 RepID=UPI0025BEAD54|nr:DUF2917 domain-containing protein [Candidatus Accumulibacter sp. ACC003]
MNFDLYNSELCLADNAPVRLMSASGVRIVCTAGKVWLTVEGEAGDFFLAAGDSHLVCGRGLALLEGIGSGRVRFLKAANPLSSALGSLFRESLLATLPRLWRNRRDLPLREPRPTPSLPACSPPVGAA